MARLAHVGYGYWGRNLARNFAELGALVAIVDENPAAAAEATHKYGVRALSFDAVLADASIDCVSLASPATLHSTQATRAMEVGKHVFVEKPLALRVDEAEALCALASKCDRKLMVGHLLQYHPIFAMLRDMVAHGELGHIRYAHSNRLSLGKFRHEENVLWSFAPHDFSMLLSLFREEPSSVTAQGNVSILPGIADFASVEMHFPSGGSAHVFTSWMYPFKEQRLVVIGEKATAVFEDSESDWNRKLALYRHSLDLSGPAPMPTKAEAEYVPVAKSEPLRNECAHFLDCIDNDREPLTNGAEGLRVLKLLQAAETTLAENLKQQGAKA
jgi:predicted dehydrogenase